ncbi:hypothetical protein DTO280E4_2229 [Paecilomyces variotii]|nr:hypothetical protein DTO280E4_2229 [Paecilomyces variotii]
MARLRNKCSAPRIFTRPSTPAASLRQRTVRLPTVNLKTFTDRQNGEREGRDRRSQYGLPNCLPIRHGNWEDSSYADICYDGSAMTGTLRPPQISIGKVDENGRLTDERQVYALCGFIRARGESDDSLNRLAQRDGLLKNVWSAQR